MAIEAMTFGDPIKEWTSEGRTMSNSDTFQPGDEIVEGGIKTAATAVSEDTLAEPTTASEISKPKSNADEDSVNLPQSLSTIQGAASGVDSDSDEDDFGEFAAIVEAENGVGVLANASVVTSSGIDLSVKTESGSERAIMMGVLECLKQWIQTTVKVGWRI